jgi:hypothetical protein
MKQVYVLIKIFVLLQTLNAVFCIHGGSQATPSDVLYMVRIAHCLLKKIFKLYIILSSPRRECCMTQTVGVQDH